jgi:hypothetical protein
VQYYGALRACVERGGLLALTAHQPMAYLLMLPHHDENAKRVENRTWRPPPWLIGKRIVVHAGMSRVRLRAGDEIKWRLVFGAGLGTVLVDGALAKAVTGSPGTGWLEEEFPPGYEWLGTHRHAQGPWCWVVGDPEPFKEPIPRSGAQGLWIWEG